MRLGHMLFETRMDVISDTMDERTMGRLVVIIQIDHADPALHYVAS